MTQEDLLGCCEGHEIGKRLVYLLDQVEASRLNWVKSELAELHSCQGCNRSVSGNKIGDTGNSTGCGITNKRAESVKACLIFNDVHWHDFSPVTESLPKIEPNFKNSLRTSEGHKVRSKAPSEAKIGPEKVILETERVPLTSLFADYVASLSEGQQRQPLLRVRDRRRQRRRKAARHRMV